EGASIEKIVAEVALQHHERFSGKGYPYGKKGRLEENAENGIHPFARIVAIADSYSALLMERVYKPALPAEEALRLLEVNSLEHFDPVFYNPFVAALKKSLNLYEEKKQSLVGNIYVVEKGDNVAQKIMAKKQGKSHQEEESPSKLSLDVHIHDEDCDHQPHGEKKLGA
ncbi:MAG: HD domain-containing phosphohydrolase, partial [Pseudomonadota bacterium]